MTLSLSQDLTGARLTDLLWDAYSAAFIDGEGSIQPGRVRAFNTYPLILFILKDLYGGKVYSRKLKANQKPQFEWCAYGVDFVYCLQRILPHLVEKKKQALIALEMLEYPSGTVKFKELKSALTKAKNNRYE